MKKVFILIVAFATGFSLKAQTLEAGLFAGGSYYLGDLNPAFHFMQTQLNLGIVARYNVDGRWAFKVGAYRGALKGDDQKSKYLEDRNLKFNMSLTEVSAVAELNFLDYFTGSLRNYFTPFIFGGMAVYYGIPKVGNLELRELGTEGQNINFDDRELYSFTNFSIPFGIGFKYSISNKICLAFEWGLRKTFADYLDDVSTTYYLESDAIEPGEVNYNELTFSDPTFDHQPYMQRGYSKTNDWYGFAGLTLTYKINLIPRGKCTEYQD
ncbi:MAG: outer membrane beta-barrel protein [Bacteroidales bacterium]|nr:outer membrane beta-barrel protein [Bacteroidales bacterium]